MELVFAKSAFRQLQKLDADIQRRILDKLRFFVTAGNTLRFADRLVDKSIGQWRFRIGDWRVIFDIQGTDLVVLRLGHRRDIYR